MKPGRVIGFCGVLAVALAAAACWPVQGLAAGLPFEPDDSLTSAFGPLSVGQAYDGGLEGGADRDFFYFYATAPTAGKVTVTVHNLGGDSGLSGVNAALLDARETPIASIPYLEDGESRSVEAGLAPQKYYVEVSPSEGAGDSYRLEVSGPIGPYGAISQRCAGAEQRTVAAKKALNQAEARLQRAIARLQRSRYAGPSARRRAQAALRAARAQRSKRTRELRDARTSREPWCSIESS